MDFRITEYITKEGYFLLSVDEIRTTRKHAILMRNRRGKWVVFFIDWKKKRKILARLLRQKCLAEVVYVDVFPRPVLMSARQLSTIVNGKHQIFKDCTV